MADRINSVNSLLKKEISNLIHRQVKDPRINDFVSIVEVKTSRNLQNATIYISVIGDEKIKKNALKGLTSASGFIQNQLRKNLDLKYVPSIQFRLDYSLDDAEKILTLLDSIDLPKNESFDAV
ncbi:MAG: ribosome-binding factor A [Chloroflexi bacterium]|nr:ribosome-binding factor A [Chloroflexota bacterium]|tara:strand:+ start:607 stop:975 length:369 start_codon:yes stop_codon:yes gene_type:complete